MLVRFDAGVPTAIDGRPVTVRQAIEELNRRAGAQGVGRLDMVEDRLVGIKSREVYEAPGAIALLTAHRELEDLTVERDLRRFAQGVRQRWTELVYDGLWFSPLKRALDAFFDSAQQHVTGEVRLRLHARHARPRPAGAATARSTTTRWPRTTPATPSTSRWPRASSSSGACRPGSRPPATSPARRPTRIQRDRQPGGARRPAVVGRPVRRRPGRGAGPAVGVGAVRLAARAVRPGRLPGARPGAAPRRPARRRTSWPGCSPPWTSWRPTYGPARSRRRSPTRTCTPRSSAGCWSGSARSAASCAPAAAATTRSPPTCGSTCATRPGSWPARWPSWRRRWSAGPTSTGTCRCPG